MALRTQEMRPLIWPEAVQIVARRKVLGQNYCRLVGHLRNQRRVAAEYWLDPSVIGPESLGANRQELRTHLGRYLRTLAELRRAVETVFPVRKAGAGNRRKLVRSR